mmetsp:Transcript_7040/g.14642  ORF Transcript_7040/g.14642 Transcript_7040/m.14642 type:complete len:574 (-) Transcript_7040:48-1769(-)
MPRVPSSAARAKDDRSRFACASGCGYLVHSRPEFGSYCCVVCSESGGQGHGEKCGQVVAPEGAEQADPDRRPLSGSELKEIEFKDAIAEISPEERVSKAEKAKEAGNSLLKTGCAISAEELYMEGIDMTEVLLSALAASYVEPEIVPRALAVYLALRLNSAQACLKQEDWSKAAEHASKALTYEESAKALYRRAVACSHLPEEAGRLEQARADFARVAQLEPTNRDARQQLQQVKERLQEERRLEKERFSFKLKGGSLYKEEHKALDRQRAEYEKEEERKRYERPEEEPETFEEWQKRKQEEAEKAREAANEEMEQKQWREENARRAAAGEEDCTFEEWKAAQSAPAAGTSKKKKAQEVVGADEVELDEEEQKLLKETSSKGYYHGRLNTVLSNAAPRPQRMEADVAAGFAPPSRGAKSGSEWNQAGTWEEREMTAWAKEKLTELLGAASVRKSKAKLPSGEKGVMSISVMEVTSLTGDAQIAMVRRQARHGFNFEAELTFRLTVVDESFDGTIVLPELGDTVAPEDMSMSHTWTEGTAPPESYRSTAGEWVDRLRGKLVEQVISFVLDYKER